MTPPENTEKPVVVFRSGHHGGLGIVRSLGRLGIPVYCVDTDRWAPAFVSRYCRRRFLLKDETDSQQCLEQLLEIGHNIGGEPILIPTTDRGTSWIADNADALRRTFCFPVQDAALVRSLSDKFRMQQLARENGVAIAQSVSPKCKQDVERFLETAVFPVMVKAATDERVRACLGATKFVVQNAGKLMELYIRAEDQGASDLMFQEFIPGEDWMFDGYFDGASRCLFGVTGKKLRRFPVHTGVTSLGVCLRNETVEKTTIAFMQAIGYRGILDIGYRRDQRNGLYKVLDVNPRIGCTFRLLAGSDGMDAARALYFDMTGNRIDRAEVPEGRKWFVEDFDLISAFRSWRAGTLTFRDWVRSFQGVQESACFAWDDPLPFLFLPVTDCCELRQWSKRRTASKRPISRFFKADLTESHLSKRAECDSSQSGPYVA